MHVVFLLYCALQVILTRRADLILVNTYLCEENLSEYSCIKLLFLGFDLLDHNRGVFKILLKDSCKNWYFALVVNFQKKRSIFLSSLYSRCKIWTLRDWMTKLFTSLFTYSAFDINEPNRSCKDFYTTLFFIILQMLIFFVKIEKINFWTNRIELNSIFLPVKHKLLDTRSWPFEWGRS